MEYGFIYWERQGKEHTCGIHTLNSILQGPFITKNIFEEKASELKEEQKLISPDLDETIVDEQGCSIELLHKCLSDFEINCKHLNIKRDIQSLLNFKGLICNNGDHFFALINYQKFWINFDSLSEYGPEYLTIDEFAELLMRQLQDEGSFIQVYGNFPREYSPGIELKGHQRIFSIYEVIENGNLIKTIRESQRRPVNSSISQDEELQIALQMSLEDSGNKEEKAKDLESGYKISESGEFDQEVLNQALLMSIEENKELDLEICRGPGKVTREKCFVSESVRTFTEKIAEKMGFSNISLYVKEKDFDFYPDPESKISDLTKGKSMLYIEIINN